MPVDRLVARLERELARSDTRIIASPTEGVDIGWVCARPKDDLLVYMYVKYEYRRVTLAKRVLSTIGMQLSEPIWVTFWTPACSRLVDKGYLLFFDTRGGFDA